MEQQGGGPLKGLFFSEFDHKTGPKVTYQEPEGIINGESFESIHEYIITKPKLCGRVLKVPLKSLKVQIWGCSVCLENPKYPRNVLMWNLCFVFGETENLDILLPWQPILIKLTNTLKTLELESEFIFNPQTKPKVKEIMKEVLYKLNTNGHCSFYVDEANRINLKLIPKLKAPRFVNEHDVPILIREVQSTEDWDLSLQQVLPFVDGINHIKRISQLSGVEVDVVRIAIQHLLYYKCVKIIDIFQYSNIYTCTPLIKNLANDETLQKECIKYITAAPGKPPPTFEKVFSLYCNLKHGVSLEAFCAQHNLQSLNIDDRRVHQYPLNLRPNKNAHLKNSTSLQRMCTGQISIDQLCCAYQCTYDEMVKTLQKMDDVVFLYK